MKTKSSLKCFLRGIHKARVHGVRCLDAGPGSIRAAVRWGQSPPCTAGPQCRRESCANARETDPLRGAGTRPCSSRKTGLSHEKAERPVSASLESPTSSELWLGQAGALLSELRWCHKKNRLCGQGRRKRSGCHLLKLCCGTFCPQGWWHSGPPGGTAHSRPAAPPVPSLEDPVRPGL